MNHKYFFALALLMAALLLLGGCTATVTAEPPDETPPPAAAELSAAPQGPVQTSREPVGGEVAVSTVDELLAAIASDTTIRLEAGVYDLSTASDYGTLYEGGWYTWEAVYDGYALVIEDVDNLTLLGAGTQEVTLSAAPRYANVLSFRDCDTLSLSGFTAGHTQEPGQCAGGVLYLENTDDTRIIGCALYGCGILGVDAMNCQSLSVENSSIYDCSYGAVRAEASRDIRLQNCEIYDCEGFGLFQFETTYGAAVVNCQIYENNCAALLQSRYAQEVYLLGCAVRDNDFSSSVFAAENHSPVVADCSFEETSHTLWYGGNVYGIDSVPMEAVSPEGTPLTGEDLAAMIRREVTYDGPASIPEEPETSADPSGESRELTVSTVDELLAAIAPNTTVYLTAGDYTLTEATGYGSTHGDYYYWTDTFDGPELVIAGVANFHLLGAGADSTRLLATPRYADILTFEDCENISLSGLTAGHTEDPSECSGGVLYFQNCTSVLVQECGLFGCGILGITARACADMQIVSTEIYDCTYGVANLFNCANVSFQDCYLHDCGNRNAIGVYESQNVTCNGQSLSE